jgi:hypothetical protein
VLCTHGVHTNTPVVAIRWETAERDARGSTGRETHRNASRGNLCARARGVRARRIAWSSREKGFSSASITFFLAFHQVFGVSWRCARRSRARSGVCARDRARGGCGEPCRMRWRREMAKSWGRRASRAGERWIARRARRRDARLARARVRRRNGSSRRRRRMMGFWMGRILCYGSLRCVRVCARDACVR